jgi:hypothetical protein
MIFCQQTEYFNKCLYDFNALKSNQNKTMKNKIITGHFSDKDRLYHLFEKFQLERKELVDKSSKGATKKVTRDHRVKSLKSYSRSAAQGLELKGSDYAGSVNFANHDTLVSDEALQDIIHKSKAYEPIMASAFLRSYNHRMAVATDKLLGIRYHSQAPPKTKQQKDAAKLSELVKKKNAVLAKATEKHQHQQSGNAGQTSVTAAA